MSENSTLQIHTQLAPDAAQVKPAEVRKRTSKRKNAGFPLSVRRAPLPLTGTRQEHGADSLTPSRAQEARAIPGLRGKAGAECLRGGIPSENNAKKKSAPSPRHRLTFTERLLRNSAIACALLLAVLALGNVREPWAQKASEGVRKALTMRINLDDSLGELTFVRSLMPESALVFLNVSGGGQMTRPVDGAAIHPWSALQPWTVFDAAGETVKCAGAGTVTAVSALSGGGYGVLVDHGEGLESVYANLSEASVEQGDSVNRGDALGTGGESLYFELRQGGESVDPSERLAL